MKVHFLRAIAPVLGDRVILLYSESKKFNEMIDEELVFARTIEDKLDGAVLSWMIDEPQEQAAMDAIEKFAGDNCWCDACIDCDEGKTQDECDVWVQEIDDLNFEPVPPLEKGEEAPVAEGGFKIPEGLKQFLKKEVGGPLAEFAKGRVKQIAKDQAKAVGVTLEDSFFEDVFNAFKSTAVESSKTMSITEAAKVLAVDWPCSKEQVVAAFRVMAKVKHPDKPGGSADAFMRIVEARTVLTRALE